MMGMLTRLTPQLRPGAPVHLLGMGDEDSIRAVVPLGVDTFDSAFPTRLGRHGTLLTSAGRLTLRKAEHARALRPPDPTCDCHVCKTYSLVRHAHAL
jgi:queuine tRNA-ribosyltransferase